MTSPRDTGLSGSTLRHPQFSRETLFCSIIQPPFILTGGVQLHIRPFGPLMEDRMRLFFSVSSASVIGFSRVLLILLLLVETVIMYELGPSHLAFCSICVSRNANATVTTYLQSTHAHCRVPSELCWFVARAMSYFTYE
jgi:hypothetical protein